MTKCLTKQTMRGFTLLPLLMVLLGLMLLLLLEAERQLFWARRASQSQRHHLQTLNQTISALAAAPYLAWQPATSQWQCHQLAPCHVCLRQRFTHPEMALLRASSVDPADTHRVTLYRFVTQRVWDEHRDPPPSSRHPPPTLLWVAGGWLDICPEKHVALCQ